MGDFSVWNKKIFDNFRINFVFISVFVIERALAPILILPVDLSTGKRRMPELQVLFLRKN
jgi:hypothetical protein